MARKEALTVTPLAGVLLAAALCAAAAAYARRHRDSAPARERRPAPVRSGERR
jgi:hypothetical protein